MNVFEILLENSIICSCLEAFYFSLKVMAATFVATDINYFGFNFRMAGMSDAHAQYEYIQLQQEQKINWTRTFTIEQQLRYGITPTGEPLDVAMLKEIQMHHNFQVNVKIDVTESNNDLIRLN